MIASPSSRRLTWFVALLAACGCVGGALFFLQRAAMGPPVSPQLNLAFPRATVLLALSSAQHGSGAQAVNSAMTDLSPLFLPSERNARLPALPLREPGDGTLDSETSKFNFRESDPATLVTFPPGVLLDNRPLSEATELDGLRGDSLSLAAGFGRSPLRLPTAAPRGGLVEVYASGTGQIITQEELAEDSHPSWLQVWHPLEFLAAIEPSGLVTPLSLTATSRVDAVDTFFRDYLDRVFRVGDRFEPGFYRIVVSP
jgi:hypothetical protein